MELNIRKYLHILPCIFGWHDWSKPTLVNRVTFSGERQEDGSWETDTTPQEQAVTQECRYCPSNRDRPDLEKEDCWNYPWPPDESSSGKFK